MLFLVISHLKVVQYYHLVSSKFSVAKVWQGADCGGAFSRPGIRRAEKYSGPVSPLCHTFCGKNVISPTGKHRFRPRKKITIQEDTILYEHSRI